MLETANPDSVKIGKLYKQAYSLARNDRPVAAQALLGLARTQERAGKPEARATYLRIVNEYADQSAAVQVARLPYWSAVWSPNSRGLLIGATDSGTTRLSQIPLDGSASDPVVVDFSRLNGRVPVPRFNPATVVGVSLSQDGSGMAFEATTLRTVELWALENVMAIVGRR